jgi:hypothetical protein
MFLIRVCGSFFNYRVAVLTNWVEGPCSVYMKKVDAFNDKVAGAGWFKIWHYGFEDGVFCTEKLRASGGMMNVTVPKDLQGYALSRCWLVLMFGNRCANLNSGRYLLRAEHLALHEAVCTPIHFFGFFC